MNTATIIDNSLLQRYDRPGPRYTSYPTVPQFRSDFRVEELYLRSASPAPAGTQPLSLYVHVPFCHSPCFYCGCNRIITRDPAVGERYVERVLAEAKLVRSRLARSGPVVQLHLGGGTPNFLSGPSLERLMQGLAAHFDFSDQRDRDFSIELDPRSLPEEPVTYGARLARLGFNRVSLGVQDFDEAVQAAVNRLQSSEQTLELIDACRDHGVRSVNIDLIYGLPKQTPENFARTVEEVISLQPDRLSVFNYAHLPERFMPQRRINSHELPSPAQKLDMLQRTIEQLTAAGYRYIGMDHFALPDDELAIAQEEQTLQRNFQGYTTHGHCDLIGLGVSAISQIGDLYCQNNSDLNQYQNTLAAAQLATSRGLVCNADDRLRRAVIQQLICNFSLEFAEIEQAFNIDFQGYFGALWPQLQGMANDGLITLERERIEVLPVGRLLVRSVCMVFDAYLEQQNRQRFSRVI
jgi:oxygen-independent coproporphyrinogen-3 oxidase